MESSILHWAQRAIRTWWIATLTAGFSNTSPCFILRWGGVIIGSESLINCTGGVQGLIVDHSLVGDNSSNGGNLSWEKLCKATSKHQNKIQPKWGLTRGRSKEKGLLNQPNCSVGWNWFPHHLIFLHKKQHSSPNATQVPPCTTVIKSRVQIFSPVGATAQLDVLPILHMSQASE